MTYPVLEAPISPLRQRLPTGTTIVSAEISRAIAREAPQVSETAVLTVRQ